LSRALVRRLLLPALLGAAACDGGKTMTMGSHAPFAGCDGIPSTVPGALGLDPFYAKYLDGYGTPVVSSAQVSDVALLRACRITGTMVSLRADVRQALAANHLHVAVLAEHEVTTNIPEYADLNTVFPGTEWNAIRAIGATHVRPVAAGDEQNLLCLPGDLYPGETALVPMLAHSLRDLGIVEVEPQFRSRIQSAYTSAMTSGLWTGSAAAADADTYWAVGAQVWFGVSVHQPVKTRAALVDYDSALATLLAAYLPADAWHPGCH
jgi:hypothetical protein